ncbi:MAG: DUF4337 domain-containing protein [Bacteroidota bacterium]|nr:DUF4337 domain-containing protein [Bacteroidota bacterium]
MSENNTSDVKDKWTNYLALTTVIIAVCATLSTFKGGGYSTKSLLCQSKASDQWAFYQSKSTKGNLAEMEKDILSLQIDALKRDVKSDLKTIDSYQKKLDTYLKKVEKYNKEKEEIKNEAEKFESERDIAKKHSEIFGFAVIFLQVSILLSSISALTKRKYLWYISLGIGIVGVFYFINGFYLFMNL